MDYLKLFHEELSKKTEEFISSGKKIIIYNNEILKIGDIIKYDTGLHPGIYYKVIYFDLPYTVSAMTLAIKDKETGIFRLDIPKNKFDGICLKEKDEFDIRNYVKIASKEDIDKINKLLTFQ